MAKGLWYQANCVEGLGAQVDFLRAQEFVDRVKPDATSLESVVGNLK